MTEPINSSALDALRRAVETGRSETIAPLSETNPYKLYAPFGDAAYEFEQQARYRGQRIYTGVDAIDHACRGTAPGELTTLLGFSHSGKTVLATHILVKNARRRMALFTPDETRTLVLCKMVALIHGIDSEALEDAVAEEDERVIALLRSTVRDHLPNLAVTDDSLDLAEMNEFCMEAGHDLGGPIEGVMFDYLDLLETGGEEANAKMNSLKAWGKRVRFGATLPDGSDVRGVPQFVLHQSNRSSGADGGRVTMTSGAFGGERQSTHMIGIRRRKYEILAEMADIDEKLHGNPKNAEWLERRHADLEYDLRIAQHTITLNVVKNKRPPCRLVDDLDFELEGSTGRIFPLGQGELPTAMRRRT